MMAENEGNIKFNIELYSLNYLGIDKKIIVETEIKKENNPKFIRNFVKNRMNFILTQNEFESNYLNKLPFKTFQNENNDNENEHIKED